MLTLKLDYRKPLHAAMRLNPDRDRPVRPVRSVRPPPALPQGWEMQLTAGGPGRQGDNRLVPGVRGAEEEVQALR
jgi:hypothetical protein